MGESYEVLKSRFLKAYSNLPEPEMQRVIAILDKPYSWNKAYAEISKDTELGKKILKKIEELGILWAKGFTKNKEN